MAIDNRQQQITVGAGLQESRYSQDFIDLLKTYLAPTLMIVALVVLGFQGWKYWQNRQSQAQAAAFKDLDSATMSGNPMSLLRVAEDHIGQQSVEPLARLQAADILLESAISKTVPGAEFGPDGRVKNEADRLTDVQAGERLAQAETQYRKVLSDVGEVSGKEVLAIAGAFGLASVSEMRKAWDEARGSYERVIELSDRVGYKTPSDIAKQRIASLEALKKSPELPSASAVKSRYDRRVLSYSLSPEQVRDGLAVEPSVMQPDGRPTELSPNPYDFAPTLLKLKVPMMPLLLPSAAPGDPASPAARAAPATPDAPPAKTP